MVQYRYRKKVINRTQQKTKPNPAHYIICPTISEKYLYCSTVALLSLVAGVLLWTKFQINKGIYNTVVPFVLVVDY